MKKTVILIVIVLNLLSVSCASRYKEITPNSQNYLSSVENGGVLLEYKYDVLKDKKYYKKEDKKGVKVVSVKITNKSGRDLVYGADIQLINSKGANLPLATSNETYEMLRQKAGYHFFYLLLSPLQVGGTDEYGKVENPFPAGLIVGPGLALSNFFTAKSANKKFQKELTDYDLYSKTIKDGETAYGLVGVKLPSHEKIDIKLME